MYCYVVNSCVSRIVHAVGVGSDSFFNLVTQLWKEFLASNTDCGEGRMIPRHRTLKQSVPEVKTGSVITNVA
jgi:hypothetical protein